MTKKRIVAVAAILTVLIVSVGLLANSTALFSDQDSSSLDAYTGRLRLGTQTCTVTSGPDELRPGSLLPKECTIKTDSVVEFYVTARLDLAVDGSPMSDADKSYLRIHFGLGELYSQYSYNDFPVEPTFDTQYTSDDVIFLIGFSLDAAAPNSWQNRTVTVTITATAHEFSSWGG